ISLIFSIVVPAKVAPNVPPSTIRSAGMLRNAAGDAPSIRAPTASPANATPIPMAVEAFMEGYWPCRPLSEKSESVWTRLAALRRRLDNRRLAPLPPGRVRDGHAPVANEPRHLVRRLGDDDPRARGKRDHRVGMRLDGDDQVGVDVDRRGGSEPVQSDHRKLRDAGACKGARVPQRPRPQGRAVRNSRSQCAA